MAASEFSGNYFLNDAQMSNNAWLIAKQLTAWGWTINAVAAMLGNMETESTINPGIWQNLDAGNTDGGYGLVQWTPATKYLNWCSTVDIEPSSLTSALLRIEYELENGLQWIQTDAYPLTFQQFKTSFLSVSYLANAFLHNYERPAELNQPARATQAEKWHEFLETGVEPDAPNTPDAPIIPVKPENKKLPLWLIIAAARRF